MRVTAGTTARSAVVAIVAVMSAIVLMLPSAITSALNLAAGTALIVPGTGTAHPELATDYLKNAVDYYVNPSTENCGSSCTAVPVPYTAQFWPIPLAGWGGLDGAKWDDSVQSGVVRLGIEYGKTLPAAGNIPNAPVAVFGYSQGATVVSIFKKGLAAQTDGIPDNVSFTLIGNPNRPNGGLFERLAILGTVPILDATFGQPTPTDTKPLGGTNTTDIAFQYDGVSDFPSAPINVLADLNAVAGFWYIHGTYLDPRGRPPVVAPDGALAYGYNADEIENIITGCKADSSGPNCQELGDTIYVTLPARSLPIMTPFTEFGSFIGASALVNPAVALLQPMTQTLIETGYDRTSYGTPTPFQIIPRVNPIKLVTDLINDIPQGIQAAIATIQSPTHTIPDLPPVWGPSATTVTVAAKGTDDVQPVTAAAPTVPKLELPNFDLPKLDLPKLPPLKLRPVKLNDDKDPATDATDTKRDFHPARDFATSIKKSLPKPPKGLERALSRLKDHGPKKADTAKAAD